MKRRVYPVALGVISAAVVGTASANHFHPTSVVMVRCTDGANAERVFVDEYDMTGATPVLIQTIEMPYTGDDALTLPGLTNHDRHVHRSVDGRFLTIAAYHAEYGSIDPSGASSVDVPRTIGIFDADGSYDLSTRLTAAYNFTAVRGAITTNGQDIWIGGDNASGATASGGTHYTTRGSSTSENLSQVQTTSGSHTPDNIRDINIFEGQLFNSSGSSSSVGKAVFAVGVGLPTSGSQTLATLTHDNASVSCFQFIDADESAPGVDVLYTATSTSSSLRKYNLVAGNWEPRGMLTGSTDVEEVVVRQHPNGEAVIYALHNGNVYRIVDAQPYGGTLSGPLGDVYLSPPAGFTLGGLALAPFELGDANCDGSVDNFDIDPFVQGLTDPDGWRAAHPDCDFAVLDTNQSGSVDNFDIDPFVEILTR